MKLNLFCYDKEEGRIKRIMEECSRYQVEAKIINLNDLIISNTKIFEKGVEASFLGKGVFFSTANGNIVRNVCRILTFKEDSNFVWPDFIAMNFADKFMGGYLLHNAKVLTPRTIFLSSCKNLEKMVDLVGGFPCVIKKCEGSKGREVSLVKSEEEITNFVDKIFYPKGKRPYPFDNIFFVLQEFIKDASGVDYRILCLNGKVIGGIRRTSQNGDFRANVSLGGKAEAFDIPGDLAEICKKIIDKYNLFYAGIDFVYSEKKGWLAIEVNTSAQFEGFERATGINVAGKIVEALIKKAKKKGFN